MDLFSPRVAYASLNTFLGSVNREIVNPLIAFLFALAIVIFLWGMFQFIWSSASDEKKTDGKMHMLWGVIGIAIMMGVWGILRMITETLGISDEVRIENSGNEGRVDIELKDYHPPTR